MQTKISVILMFIFIIASLLAAPIGICFSTDIFRTQPLSLLLLVGAIGLIYHSIIFRKEKISLPTGIISLLLLIAFYQIIISYTSFELYLQILLFFCYFMLFYQYFQKQRENGLYIIAFIATCFTIIIIIIGLLQYIEVIETDSKFPVVGVFDNPAGIASILVILLPFTFHLFQKKWENNVLKNITLIVIIVSSCFTIYVSDSRSGIISVILVILLSSSFITKKKKVLLVLCIIPFLMPLYFYKKDSADGRIFIWSNTINIIKDNILQGSGYDGFMQKYMTYQAKYFKLNTKNEEIKRIASDVRNPMNEYLGFMVAWGIIGVLLMIILIAYIIHIYKQNNDSFKRYAIISLTALAVFSFFSYPLSYPINQVLLSLNLAIILCPISRYKDSNIVNNTFVYIISGLSLILASYTIYCEHQWKKAHTFSRNGSNTYVVEYTKLRQMYYFKNNRAFLYDYTTFLYEDKDYIKCLSILKHCENYINDYDTQMIAGYCYKEIGQWSKAEQCFYKAHYMVPHKFTPLFELMEGAYKRKDTKTVISLAQTITSKPIKIKSYKVNIIKNRAKEILSMLNKEGGAF